MSIEDTSGQLSLFDPEAEQRERVTGMVERIAVANATRPSPELDAELQQLQVEHLVDGAGFTLGRAEQAVQQLDPADIVTEGVKRTAELRKQRREPKTGRAKVDEIARLSTAAKRVRDSGLAPPNIGDIVPRWEPTNSDDDYDSTIHSDPSR